MSCICLALSSHLSICLSLPSLSSSYTVLSDCGGVDGWKRIPLLKGVSINSVSTCDVVWGGVLLFVYIYYYLFSSVVLFLLLRVLQHFLSPFF